MAKEIPPIKRKLRCAVYTRKSSEEGLEQEFNSLDAQREACEAYVASQKAEGWLLVPDRYDDGGFSGGTLERPALQRLIQDIEAKRIWEQYESRFKSVDEDFGKAADRFHEEVSRHQEAMRDFVTNIDAHTSNILGKVNSAVTALSESIETLNETFDEKLGSLTRTTAPHQAAE